MDLKAADPVVDDDPWPRPAPVGEGSAYAAIALARPVEPTGVQVGDVGELPAPRVRPLASWQFDGQPVAVPDCWSRRDPGLVDFRGPAAYEREVEAEGPYARVVFDHVDYLATVFVDSERRFLHEGGFVPLAVDVPAGRPVTVRVEVDDPVEPSLLEPDPLLRPKRKVKGVHEEHDSRPGGMAIGPHHDPSIWGVRWGTGGMGLARLHETGAVRIDAVFVTAEPGSLRVNWVLTNLADSTDVELRSIVDDAGGRAGFSVAARLAHGPSRVAVRLAMSGESTWSPEHPAVCALRTAAVVDGAVSDVADTTFGVRRVEMDVEGPEQFHLRLDGRKTYVRAANYIGGVWPPELEDGRVARDVELALRAGLNSFGVHAGVCMPLLDEADRRGLLVYQDFPLQWSYDPDGGPLAEGGPTFAQASLWLAAELVYRFYNHPSVVYWCGHNEPAYQLREVFKSAHAPELLGVVSIMDSCPNEEALDLRRRDLFRHVDPSRPAMSASGLGASREAGDHHNYTGSLSSGSATRANAGKVAFLSEFGAWTANFSAASVGGTGAPAARGDWPPPPEAELDWNTRTHLFATQVTYAGRPSRFADFQTWCFAGQLWAGWHAKVVVEKSRLGKWAPSGAQRYHFFVDHWGDAGAGVVDRFRTTGPAYRGLAAANRPVVALAPFPDGARVVPGAEVRLPIVVVNDLDRPLRTKVLRWRLSALGPDDCWLVGRDDPEWKSALQNQFAPPDQVCVVPRRYGTTLLSGSVTVDVEADACVQVDEVVWTAAEGEAAGPVALFLDLDGIVGWTSFMVAPDGWQPVPGLSGPTRFTVTARGRPGELRRRWTGEVVSGPVPPDQYLLGDLAVDVYDDVHVEQDGRVVANELPWPDPLSAF